MWGSVKNIFSSIYISYLRGRLPGKVAEYNGVQVRTDRIFGNDKRPNYEGALVSAIENHVEREDSAVIVGGGYGVSTVRAAEAVGEFGSVVTYEGSKNHVHYINETLEMNEVEEIVTVEHAIVGKAVKLLDDPGDARMVKPSELPECDVLIMDCEGSEKEILKNLEILPTTIIVETHDHLGSTEDDARHQLTKREYTILSSELESRDPKVAVITAKKDF